MKVFEKIMFTIGVATGGVIGMLYAQKSGKDLREQLKKSKKPIKDLGKELLEMGENIADNVMSNDLVKNMMCETEDGVLRGRGLVKKLAHRALSEAKRNTRVVKSGVRGLNRKAKVVVRGVAKSAKKISKKIGKKIVR